MPILKGFPMTADPPTEAQASYIRVLQKRLHLPNALLDGHCVSRFRKPFAALDKREASQLLDEMIGWQALPADLQRAKGQQDLPGFAS